MGFPVGYSDLPLPNLLLHLIFFLAFLRQIISSAFHAVGLGDLLDSDPPAQTPHGRTGPESRSVSAILIQEILPVVRYEDLLREGGEIDRRLMAEDRCAVCLYEIEACEEVRRLSNCRHVFHRGCLDGWMQHDQRTCPLCRISLVPEKMQEEFNLRLWGVPDSDSGDFSSPSSFSVAPLSSPLL